MHDHNLDDLILDAEPRSGGGLKSLLSLLALFIVVLIAGIVFSKTFFHNSAPSVTEEENITRYVSPELTLREETEPPAPEASETHTANTPTPKMEAKQTDAAKREASSRQEKNFIEIPDSAVPAAKSETKTSSKREPSNHSDNTVRNERKVASANKTSSKKHTQRHTKSSAAPIRKATPAPRYYVQVGSFSKAPSSNARLLRVIRNSGYRFIVYETGGMHKILIGPYSSRAQADKAIGTIRAKINKQAFVYTMK
jgi:cell division septation protein DedD